MAKTKKSETIEAKKPSVIKKMPPSKTVEGRENELISLAVDEAERLLREHKAPSQIIVHYLRLGTTRELLEKKRIEQDIKLNQAKTDAIESSRRIEELYEGAIQAMRSYAGLESLSGQPEEDDD